MNRSQRKRPLFVTVIGCLYVAVGAIGLVVHFPKFPVANALRYDVFWIELVELLALLCGVFLLRGYDWVRWLAVAWIAFHVVLSAFQSLREFFVHAMFCTVIVWLLFRPEAARYFRRAVAGTG